MIIIIVELYWQLDRLVRKMLFSSKNLLLFEEPLLKNKESRRSPQCGSVSLLRERASALTLNQQ